MISFKCSYKEIRPFAASYMHKFRDKHSCIFSDFGTGVKAAEYIKQTFEGKTIDLIFHEKVEGMTDGFRSGFNTIYPNAFKNFNENKPKTYRLNA